MDKYDRLGGKFSEEAPQLDSDTLKGCDEIQHSSDFANRDKQTEAHAVADDVLLNWIPDRKTADNEELKAVYEWRSSLPGYRCFCQVNASANGWSYSRIEADDEFVEPKTFPTAAPRAIVAAAISLVMLVGTLLIFQSTNGSNRLSFQAISSQK